MARKTRAEKRAEEARIIAQLYGDGGEAAPQEGVGNVEKTENSGEKTAQKMHCKRCKSVMENGVCPVCGFRVYMPMDEKKRRKIRLIVGSVCVVAFVALLLVYGLKK